jgi:hypothetical protein
MSNAASEVVVFTTALLDLHGVAGMIPVAA